MDLFHVIDEGVAILRIRGATYKQTKIFRRGTQIYAEASGGFVQLLKGNGTSNPRINWLDVEGPNVSVIDRDPKWVQPPTPKPAAKAKTKLKVVGS